MIKKIGVIYQDRNSFEFLQGLRDRLGCEAELVDPPAAIGKTQRLPRRQARHAWLHFQKRGVDLVVRFTDADGQRWQDVHRAEMNVVPDQAKSIWICGVSVNNVEEWLCLDLQHLAELLFVPGSELHDKVHRTDRIKRALVELRQADEKASDLVAKIVRDLPSSVFRKWLKDDALARFYTDCRSAAASAECETPNELSEGGNE